MNVRHPGSLWVSHRQLQTWHSHNYFVSLGGGWTYVMTGVATYISPDLWGEIQAGWRRAWSWPGG